MRVGTIARRATELLVALETLRVADAVAIANRTDEAEGPCGDAGRSLGDLRESLNRLYALHGPREDDARTLFLTTDRRLVDRLGDAVGAVYPYDEPDNDEPRTLEESESA